MKTTLPRADISFVNISKTLTMFFVVLGHLSIPQPLHLFVSSFHMPLFFIMSGYLISTKVSVKSFFIKKVKTLLIPYYVFAIISVMFWFFIGRKYGDDAVSENSFTDYIIGTFFAIPSKEYLGFNFPLWFLTSLLCSELIFYWCLKHVNKLLPLVSIVCFCLGILLKEILPYRLPFGFDVSLFSILFLQIGYYVKEKDYVSTLISQRKIGYKIFFVVLFFCLTIFISNINESEGYISMAMRRLNNYLLFLVGAFSGSLFILFLSNSISQRALFSFYGRNTIIILGLHLMCLSFVKAVQVFIFHLPLDISKGTFLINTIYVICVFVILAPVIYLINKYIPFVLGRKKGII